MKLNIRKTNYPIKKGGGGGRRPKQTSLQRRHRDGQQAHGKMLNITHYQTNANHWSEWPLLKNLQTINAGEGVKKREPTYTVDGDVN